MELYYTEIAPSGDFSDVKHGLVKRFDDGDAAYALGKSRPAQFDIDIRSVKYVIDLDREIAAELGRIAQHKRISTNKLINILLREKLLGN